MPSTLSRLDPGSLGYTYAPLYKYWFLRRCQPQFGLEVSNLYTRFYGTANARFGDDIYKEDIAPAFSA